MIDLNYDIRYKVYSSLRDDFDNWVAEIKGDVHGFNDDNHEVSIAKVKAYFINIKAALSAGVNHVDLFDSSGELLPYLENLYEIESPEFNQCTKDKLNYEPYLANLFIIHRIEVLPEYRGQHLGRAIIDQTVGLFSSSADVVALKSYPLQFEVETMDEKNKDWGAKMQLNKLELTKRKAKLSLRNYYQSLDFIHITDGFMVKLIHQ